MTTLLNEKDVAVRLGVDVKTLQAWRSRHNNKIPFVRISARCIRYRLEDVEGFVASRLVGKEVQ